MTKTLNLRQRLHEPETTRFIKRYSEQVGRQVALRDIPLKNFVDVDSNLLETKVASLFMMGATDAAGFWPDLINVVNMRAAKDNVPIISQRDFDVRTGKISGAAKEGSGGKVRSVNLDTTDDHHIRYVYFKVDEEDVRLNNFSVVEKSITAAGQALAKHILGDITSHYVSKAGNSQALSTDLRFEAIVKAIGLNRADGFGCSAIVIEGSDFDVAVLEENAGGVKPWLGSLQNSQPMGDNFGRGVGASGFVGRLFGRIPVFVVSNDTNLDTNILCVDVPSAAAFGFAPGGQIELRSEIKHIDDIVNNLVRTKYDIANPDDDGSGNTNAVAKVTGA